MAAAGRFTRALRTVAQWCRLNRHRPIAEQHQTLCQKVRGHLAYYGIAGNGWAWSGFVRQVPRVGRKWLARRKRADGLPWPRFLRLLARYPRPPAVVVHSVYRTAVNP